MATEDNDRVTEALKEMVADEQKSKRKIISCNLDLPTVALLEALKARNPKLTAGHILTQTIRYMSGVGEKPKQAPIDRVAAVRHAAATGRIKLGPRPCDKCGRPFGDCAHTSTD